MIISVFDNLENIVGKGENAFPQCFQKVYSSKSFKLGIV